MSRGPRSLPDRLRLALAGAAGWMSRSEIDAAVVASPIAIDDALADLVEQGAVEFRVNVGYRIAATPLCRRALKQLQAEGLTFAMAGAPAQGGYRLGIADRRPNVGLVLYELALPSEPQEDQLAALQKHAAAAVDFFNARGSAA